MRYYVGFQFQKNVEDPCEFYSHWEWDKGHNDIIAEDAAEHLHLTDESDIDWPVEITIYDCDDKELGRFEVNMEMTPTFSATEIKGGVA